MTPSSESTKPSKLLIADDNQQNCELLEAYLSDENYEFSFAVDGEETLLRVAENQPDLLLLDMMLPDGCGLDVLEALSEWEPVNRPTTVVLTASNDPQLLERCSELKVHDLISKPVHEDEFMRVVRDHKKLMVHGTQTLSSTT